MKKKAKKVTKPRTTDVSELSEQDSISVADKLRDCACLIRDVSDDRSTTAIQRIVLQRAQSELFDARSILSRSGVVSL